MTSNIDVTVPVFGSPTTQSVRNNFTIARNEITALQNAGASLSSGVIGSGSVTPTPPFGSLYLNANTVAPPGGLPPGLAPNLYVMGADGMPAGIVIDSFGTDNSSLTFRHAANTAASPTAVQSGDVLGYLIYTGRGATKYLGAANIGVAASENWSDTATGTFINFAVTPNGTTNAITGLTIAGTFTEVPTNLAVGPAAADSFAPNSVGSIIASSNVSAQPAGLNGGVVVVAKDNGFAIVAADAFGPNVATEFIGRRARGTAAAQSAVQSGDELAALSAFGYGATSYGQAGGVFTYASENWTDSAHGSSIFLQTNPNGSTALVPSLELQGNTATFSGLVQVVGGTVQLSAVGGGHQWIVTDNPTGFAIGDQTLGVDRIQVDNLGNCTASSAWGLISDAALKSNVEDHTRGLVEVMKLQPRNFSYIDGDRASSGLIAQELAQVMPELVGRVTAADGRTFLTVRETGIIWPLVNAVKELKAELDQLKAKLEGTDDE